MRLKRAFMSIALLCASFSAGALFADDDKNACPVCDTMNLPADVKAKVKDAWMQKQKHMHEMMVNLHAVRADLMKLLKSEDATEATIMAKVDESLAIRRNMILERVRFHTFLKSTLTPEQHAQWHTAMAAEHRKGHHGEMKGCHRDGKMEAHECGESDGHCDDEDDDEGCCMHEGCEKKNEAAPAAPATTPAPKATK